MTRMIFGKTIALVLMAALILGVAGNADAQRRGHMMDRQQTQNYDDQWRGHGPGMMGGRGMMGPGMMGGRGMMGGQDMPCPIMNQMGYGMGMATPLNIPGLTPEQRDEIGAIQREMRRENMNAMADIMDIRDNIMDEMATARPDPEKIRELQNAMGQKQAQMMETSVENRNRIYDLLDEEQQGMIQEYQRQPADRIR